MTLPSAFAPNVVVVCVRGIQVTLLDSGLTLYH